MSVTHFAHGWILGRTFCSFTGSVCSVPVTANINFILAISLHRYARCKYPLGLSWLNKTRVRILAWGIWLYSCTFIVYVFCSKAGVAFNPKLGGCVFNFTKSTGNLLIIILTTLVPFLIILSMNLALWWFVHQVANRTRAGLDCDNPRNKGRCRGSKQALLITSSITAIFAVCWFPTVVRFMLSAVCGEEVIPTSLERLRYVYFVGTYANPLLYTALSKKFRQFVSFYFKKCLRENCVREDVLSSVVVPGTPRALTPASMSRSPHPPLHLHPSPRPGHSAPPSPSLRAMNRHSAPPSPSLRAMNRSPIPQRIRNELL